MTLREMWMLYLRARLISWLFGTHQFVFVTMTDGTRLNLAAFWRGRYCPAAPQSPFPDIVPPEWQDKPPGETPKEP